MKYTADIQKYADKGASWLNEFDWSGIRFVRLPKWVPFVGIYLPLLHMIGVQPDHAGAVFEIATCVHELRHAYQHHTMGLAMYVFKKAFNRKALEEDAEKWECDYIMNTPYTC